MNAAQHSKNLKALSSSSPTQRVDFVTKEPRKQLPILSPSIVQAPLAKTKSPFVCKKVNINFSKQTQPLTVFKLSFDNNKTPVLVEQKISEKNQLCTTAVSTNSKFTPKRKSQGETSFKVSEAKRTCCNFCNIEFNNPELFKMHFTRHTPGQPWKCSRCHVDQKDVCNFFRHIDSGCRIQER